MSENEPPQLGVHRIVRRASDVAEGQVWRGRSKPHGVETVRHVRLIRRIGDRGLFVHWENREQKTDGLMKLSSFRTWADELL